MGRSPFGDVHSAAAEDQSLVEKIDQINEAKLFLQLRDKDGDQHGQICSYRLCDVTVILCYCMLETTSLWTKLKCAGEMQNVIVVLVICRDHLLFQM